jgi:hypothetical protein
MNTRPSISMVTKRVDEQEDRALSESQTKAQELADVRGAAGLNYLDLCVVQSGRRVKTNADFKALRILLGTGDEIVRLDGDDAVTPAGFGPAVIPVQSGKLDAVAKALAAAAASEGRQDKDTQTQEETKS